MENHNLLKEKHMEQTLELLGIKTDLLTSKPLFTRLETEEIFGCTHQTLKSFERRELIKPSRFKNKNFYFSIKLIIMRQKSTLVLIVSKLGK